MDLYTLISDVLFVPDTKEKDKYHPAHRKYNAISSSVHINVTGARMRLTDCMISIIYHRHNEFWRQQAMKETIRQLTQFRRTRMLVCGEDLGMIPGLCFVPS